MEDGGPIPFIELVLEVGLGTQPECVREETSVMGFDVSEECVDSRKEELQNLNRNYNLARLRFAQSRSGCCATQKKMI